MHRLVQVVAGLALACGSTASAIGNDLEFPYDRELLLDVRPMSGSKRLPGLEVATGGAASIDLWCNSGAGQVVVAAETVTIIPGPMSEQQCAAERMQGDADLLAALSEVTTWHRDGDVLVLVGPRTLRYRLMTN
jgi:heat shock protein HslJ